MPSPTAKMPTHRARLAARRDYAGPAFLSHGFRPFFLAAALWSTISLMIWLSIWLGLAPDSLAFDVSWHAHEMLFGFVAAAIAGFILTAIPNWTGRLPVRGFGLGALAMLWLAGRVAMLGTNAMGNIIVAGVDSAFLLSLAFVVWREIIAGRNWRNSGPAAIISLLAAANIFFHSTLIIPHLSTAMAERLAIMLIIILISVIGGRVVPSFTRNVLAKSGAAKLPTPMNRFDVAVIAITAITGLSWTFRPEAGLSGVLAALAAVLHIVRLGRWRGLAIAHEPMLWVLHIGYLWIGVGFGLLGTQILTGLVPPSAAIHAFTAGTMGTMIVAIMTRATLGHNGMALKAGPATVTLYICVTLATLMRLMASINGATVFFWLSGGLWVLAFALFAAAYWKPLTRNMRAAPS